MYVKLLVSIGQQIIDVILMSLKKRMKILNTNKFFLPPNTFFHVVCYFPGISYYELHNIKFKKENVTGILGKPLKVGF